MQLTDFMTDGQFDLQKMAVILRTSAEKVAMTAGLNEDAPQSDTTQSRLHDMAVVLDKVTPRIGSPLMAYAWYRSKPIPRFGDRTAMQVVQQGMADRVLEYIDAVEAGVYA